MTISRDVFRTGMRHLAAGVCVITTSAHGGGRFGLTATAVCSVSADPPTLLVCLNNSTTTCKEILESGRFAVNVLAGHDQEIAQVFASPLPPEERFNVNFNPDPCVFVGSMSGGVVSGLSHVI
jgi:flavin reductase (NADH)/flavin reductase